MNKETRSFIWGLILVLVCGSGFALHVIEIENGIKRTLYDWVAMAFTSFALYAGVVRVYKAVD